MTTRTVQVAVSAPSSSGPVPLTASSSVLFTLTNLLKVGGALVVPEPVSAPVGSTIDLEVTPAGWAYKMLVRTEHGTHGPLWVLVNPGGTIALVDLPVIDPKTLAAVDPGPAWWAVADGIVAARDQAVSAASAATSAAGTATAAATSATGSASTASAAASDASSSASTATTKAGDASSSAASASGSATSAGQAKAAAEAARDAALAGTWSNPVSLFSSDDLNARTTSGLFISGNTNVPNVTRNWPSMGGSGLALLAVIRSGSTVQQTVTALTGSTSAVGRAWRRSGTTADGGTTWTWSAWRVDGIRTSQPSGQPGVEMYPWDDVNGAERQLTGLAFSLTTQHLDTITAPGVYACAATNAVAVSSGYPVDAPGIPGLLKVAPLGGFREQTFSLVGSNAASGRSMWVRVWNASTWSPWREFDEQRVDRTAGLAIYSRDHAQNREQLVYGDTGWRDLRDTNGALQNGWVASAALVRRTGYTVEWQLNGLSSAGSTTDIAYALGAGWRPRMNQSWTVRRADGSFSFAPIDTGGRLFRTVNFNTQASAEFTLMYSTTDAWPTSLPGTPVGTIPNA